MGLRAHPPRASFRRAAAGGVQRWDETNPEAAMDGTKDSAETRITIDPRKGGIVTC